MDFQKAIISTLLNFPEKLGAVNLSPDDFSDPTCRSIYNAIIEVSKDTPVDLVTVANYLSKTTQQDWVKPVASIQMYITVPDHLDVYVSEARRASLSLTLRRLCSEVAHGPEEVDVEAFTRSVLALSRTDKKWLTDGKQCLLDAFDDIQKASEGKGGSINIGFEKLDSCLGGWHNSDLAIIGARPAMGKTALLLSLQRSCKSKSLIISCEMGRNQLGHRLISQQSGVCARSLRLANLTDNDWHRVTQVSVDLGEKKWWVYDKPGPTISEVAQQARIAKHEHGVEIIFVDYVQIIRAASDSRVNEIEEVVMGLKNIARELDVPVVALAQVNRNCEDRTDKRPMMCDLKGSGAIEQEADIIGFLYRDHVYNEASDPTIAELNVAKNRHGPTGMIELSWSPKIMRFGD